MFKHEKIDLGYNDLSANTTESGRVYNTPSGNYPSITTVLKLISQDSIEAWKKRVGEEEARRIGMKAARRGTLVHEIIERYLNNEKTSDNPDYLPHIRHSLQNLRPILDRSIGKIFGLETPLYSDHLGLAGRCDCVAEWNNIPSIIDFKTSKKPKKKEWIPQYFAQCAGYAIMWEERTGMPISQLVIAIDVDNDNPIIFLEKRDNWTKLLIETTQKYKDQNPVWGSPTVDME